METGNLPAKEMCPNKALTRAGMDGPSRLWVQRQEGAAGKPKILTQAMQALNHFLVEAADIFLDEYERVFIIFQDQGGHIQAK
jgi:hypothetical protein